LNCPASASVSNPVSRNATKAYRIIARSSSSCGEIVISS
jgi:hypothetical protein